MEKNMSDRIAAIDTHETTVDAGVRWRFRVLLGVTIAFLFLLFWPALGGRLYVARDLGDYQLPDRYVYAQGLARGEVPVYFDGIFCGYYMHGEGQMGMYHPLFLILYRFFPLDVAFSLELL